MRLSLCSIAFIAGSLVAAPACTTTSTVGENLPSGGGRGAGAGEDPVGLDDSPSTPPPGAGGAGDPSGPLSATDTQGVVTVDVRAEQELGSVNPMTDEQPGYTVVRITLRDQDWVSPTPAGAAGTCQTRTNNPNAVIDDHAMDLAFSAVVTAAGAAATMEYHQATRTLSGWFSPVLPDGTPISVTFGPEVPALSGRTITLPAMTTTLLSPSRKPGNGVRELRAYTPGADLPISWTAIGGAKWILAAEAGLAPKNLVDCFPGPSATSFTVPASYMDTVTQVANAATQFPLVNVGSRTEQVEDVATIRVRKTSESALSFQLNLVP